MTTTPANPPNDLAAALKDLEEPLPLDKQDHRRQRFDAKRREHAHEIHRLADLFGRAGGIVEDGVYRFYHQSFKVSNLGAAANQAYALFEQLCPAGCRLNSQFVEIAENANRAWNAAPDLSALNSAWATHARPVLEFAFHCDYFLCQLVRYESVEFASVRALPSGAAALLELCGIR